MGEKAPKSVKQLRKELDAAIAKCNSAVIEVRKQEADHEKQWKEHLKSLGLDLQGLIATKRDLLTQLEQAIEREGPQPVAAAIVTPDEDAGGEEGGEQTGETNPAAPAAA